MDDLKRIALSLVVALVMLLAGAAVVLWLRGSLDDQHALYRHAQAQRVEARTRLDQAREEEQQLRAAIARYENLAARGLIGEEERLNWVEAIRAVRSARKLFDLQYEIAPQRRLDQAILPASSGAYEFRASAMRLQMDLLHEGDLFALIGDLGSSTHAYLRPRTCTVERQARPGERRPPAQGASLSPQLKADCVIDWITVRPPRSGAPTG